MIGPCTVYFVLTPSKGEYELVEVEGTATAKMVKFKDRVAATGYCEQLPKSGCHFSKEDAIRAVEYAVSDVEHRAESMRKKLEALKAEICWGRCSRDLP